MTHLNKMTTATTLVLAAMTMMIIIIIITTTVASFVITSNLATPAVATTTANNITATTTTSSPSSGVELSAQPIYQEQEKLESQTPINQTHFQVVVSANGTLTLPNGTETIRITSTKTGIVSMMEGAFSGKEVLTTEDGSENATATVYEIVRFNLEDGNGRGIAIAFIHTDSTGRLAPLNGLILTGIDEFYANQTGLLTLWEWQSGIPLPPTTTTTMEEPPLMNTTRMTTNANAADTNATAAPEEEGEGEGEGEQQQLQTTPTIPSPLL